MVRISDVLKKLAKEVLSGIETDQYLEDAENTKKEIDQKAEVSTDQKDLGETDKKVKVTDQDPKVGYKPPPKFKPSRKEHSFKNKWNKKETMTEYMREYRMNNKS